MSKKGEKMIINTCLQHIKVINKTKNKICFQFNFFEGHNDNEQGGVKKC